MFGQYLLSDTISIPVGSTVVGEFFPVLLASGDKFSDENNPKVIVASCTSRDPPTDCAIPSKVFIEVGKSGDQGTTEIGRASCRERVS